MLTFSQRTHKLSLTPRAPDSELCPMPFIVGSARSGTTLLRFMLDAHSELAIPPETGFFTTISKLKGSGEKLKDVFFRAIVNYPETAPSWPDFEIPQETFRRALTEIEPFNISEGYRAFYRLYAARLGKSRWGDKTPIHCLYLTTIRHVLPEAHFIHLIRDGRDAALSLREMWFSPGFDIEVQASYWRDCVMAARRDGAGCADYIEIRYEDLICNPQETLNRVCAHVGLSFESSMLNYYMHPAERLKEHKARSRCDGTAGLTVEQRFRQQRLTTTPPDVTRVFAWKRTMGAEERSRFEAIAGDLLEELGYEV
jgi:hypothetical protein